MGEQVTLDAEFLRRALGHGRDGDPADVEVTPGALPSDFPVTLPEWVGLRVLGGVRSAAPRWTFHYPGSRSNQPPERVLWRAFLDVPMQQPEVMDTLLAHLESQGWQAAQIFQQVFVERERSQWMGAHLRQGRKLDLFARGEGGVTQVWLNVTDMAQGDVDHLLGRRSHPHFADHFEAPLPTLTLPEGWTARMLTGQGGPIRSQSSLLLSPQAAPDVTALLSHFLPQLERQGWRLLHREDHPESLSVYRTPLGTGTLALEAGEEEVRALLLHATSEEGRGGQRSSVKIT
ncbi:hypothetical protein [Deinococcus aluminii]|uniref:Uncharacterized protein n=1 Tax=Deinococcus aluminii TaxID=1656885 RepID=A0ABP9XCG5_9DEIO